MSDDHKHVPADYRRAAALIHAHGHTDTDGMNQVLIEAFNADRNTQLFLALADLYQSIVAALITPLGRDCLGQVVLGMAADPHIDPDFRRAAQFIAHQGSANPKGVDAVLVEADEANRIAELLMAILKLYAQCLPMLYAPLGLQTLRNTEMDLLAQELDDDQ
jgi:hypothetical protein